MSNAGKATDGLLDALSAANDLAALEKSRADSEKKRADTYERQMDRAMAAVEEAKQLQPDDYHLDRIERALTE